MKYPFSLFFCLFAVAFLAGCGAQDSSDTSSSGEADGLTTLTVMTGGPSAERMLMEEIVADFEAENPDIKVNLLVSPNDTETRKTNIITSLKGQQADPDVFTMDIAWIGQMASSGWLTDLTPYELDTSPFFPSIIQTADTYEGKLVALPNFIDAGLLYYRKDLLEKHGYDTPPESWEELVEMASTIQAAERAAGNANFWGFVWQGAQYEGLICNALEYFASSGGGFLDSDGEVIIDSDPNTRALKFMVDLIHTYKVSPPNTYTDMKEEEARRVWHTGNALFMRNWPYAIGISRDAEDSQVVGKFGIAPLPSFPDSSPAATLGGWHIGLSPYSDAKDAGIRFMEYYTSYDVQKKWWLELGFNPPRPALYDDPEVREKLPYLIGLQDVFLGAIARPNVPYYAEISEVMQKHFNSALAQSESVEDALKQSQSEVREIVRKYE